MKRNSKPPKVPGRKTTPLKSRITAKRSHGPGNTLRDDLEVLLKLAIAALTDRGHPEDLNLILSLDKISKRLDQCIT